VRANSIFTPCHLCLALHTRIHAHTHTCTHTHTHTHTHTRTHAREHTVFCNDRVHLDHFNQTFTDGSPANDVYGPFSSCEWLLSPIDPVIGVVFTLDELDVVTAGSSLALYDGVDTSAPLLANFTGVFRVVCDNCTGVNATGVNGTKPVFESAQGKMLVTFISGEVCCVLYDVLCVV